MRGTIYDVYVPLSLPLMLCIGCTTITTGKHQACEFADMSCLRITKKPLIMIVLSSFNDVVLSVDYISGIS
jgi:hypothetical protein